MLSCNRCRRRCIGSLISVHLLPPLPLPVPLPLVLRRTYNNLTTSRRPPSTSPSPPLHSPPSRQQPDNRYGLRNRPLLDQIALTDPARLAETVRRRLAQGDTEAAVDLARYGSRTMNSVVSWNHVIKHHVDRGDIKNSLLTFNQMKKRKIQPDSYTFTILLNGISNYAHFGQSLERALHIYSSLSSPKSPVPPNIIHTNIVLEVCSRAGDLDSMWNIVGRLPMKGPNSPNTITYTALLNGIYYDRSKGQKLSDVEDARRVWAGVLSRWAKGQLWIDEELTCAMGRLLLMGSREDDWKQVFSVVEQVFGIKSLVDQPPPKQITADTIYMEYSGNPIKYPALKTAPTTATAATAESPTQVDDVQQLSTPGVAVTSYDSSFSTRPRPGNSTLSLLLQACAELKDHPTALKYWTTLTNPPFSVVPDLENYHDHLRILRRFRSGPEALSVVESMRVRPTSKTIYIALSACKRSGRSKNYPSAETLLSLTAKHGLLPVDVKIWNMLLQCAVKSADPAHIKQALRRIDEGFDMRSELMQRRDAPYFLGRALELLRAMIGAVDVLLYDGLAISVRWGHGERARFEDRGKVLRSWLKIHGAWGVGRSSYRVDMAEDGEEP